MSLTINSPSKEERLIANKSFDQLVDSLNHVTDNNPEIEIEETGEKIRVPLSALKLLADVLGQMKQGKPVSLVPVASEMTTQAAAEYLNCSRPHVVKLLEEGEIPYTLVGRHRRVKLSDLKDYKSKSKAKTKALLIEMMQDAEDMNLYDS